MSANGEINVAVRAEGVDDAAAQLDGEGQQDMGLGGGGGDGGDDGGQPENLQIEAFTKGGIIGGIIASLDSIISFIQPILDLLNAFLAPIAVLLLRLLQPAMSLMIKILPMWMSFFDAVFDFMDWWEGIMNGVYDWLFALPGNIWQAIKSGASWITNGAASIASATWQAIKSGASWITNGAASIASSTWKAIKSGAAWITNGAANIGSKVWEKTSKTLSDLWDILTDLPGDLWNEMQQLPGMIANKIGGVIPGNATGGVVTSPGLSFVAESGPEAIIPLDRLEQMLDNSGGGNTRVEIGGGLAPFVERVNRDPDISL